MSGRYVGAALAIVCGVATGYTTFAPELQKQQAEREGGAEFAAKHGSKAETSALQKGEDIRPNQTIISNEASIGKEVKDKIREATSETKAEKSWPGISFFKRVYGGDSSSDAAKSGDAKTPGNPGQENR